MSRDRKPTLIEATPQAPGAPGETARFGGLRTILRGIFSWGKASGARAAEAAVSQLESNNEETKARARNLDAQTQHQKAETLKEVWILIDSMADDPPGVRQMKLMLLAHEYPALGKAIGELIESAASLKADGTTITVVDAPEATCESLPKPGVEALSKESSTADDKRNRPLGG